jgi:hypothetical protein
MSKILTLAQINESSADDQANIYMEKYSEHLSAYESNSSKSRINESISPYEIVAIGQQLDQFMNYHKFCESQGTLGSLGSIPQIALDVITASVGASILPLLASMQPMAEEHGIVYYKEIKAAQTSNGYTANDVISSPLQRDNIGTGKLGGARKQVILQEGTINAQVTYTGTLTAIPIRPYMFTIQETVADVPTAIYGKDDGQGNILGFGISGTINYTTGAWSVTYATNPTLDATKDVVALFDVDVDGQTSLDKIQGGLKTKDIRAEVVALAADVGAFANFAFQNRFGRSATDEVAADLTNEITRILNTMAVQRILANRPTSGATATWTQNVTGVSYAENKLTFVDAVAAVEALLHANSGAAVANRIIAGKTAAAVLRGMPDFVIAPDASLVSVGLYGYYDGVPVIRATGVVADADMVFLSNSGNYFNAPLAYAPFMPLLVTNTVQTPSNPFKSTTAAGIWSGMTALNGNLSATLIVVAGP